MSEWTSASFSYSYGKIISSPLSDWLTPARIIFFCSDEKLIISTFNWGWEHGGHESEWGKVIVRKRQIGSAQMQLWWKIGVGLHLSTGNWGEKCRCRFCPLLSPIWTSATRLFLTEMCQLQLCPYQRDLSWAYKWEEESLTLLLTSKSH